MNFEQIILIILSGLGVFHGIFISIILWNYKGALQHSNRLLSILMLVLSVRIGKSVILEFSNSLEILYVYIGLCLLLFIGPLFYLYSRQLVSKESRFVKADLIHFIPGLLFLVAAIPFQTYGFRNLPDPVVISLFIVFYCHLLAYLVVTKLGYVAKENATNKEWLNILFYGLMIIWAVYVLNLFEESIPYIIGPILYSLTVYIITYLAFSRKYLQVINSIKYKTTSFSKDEIEPLFDQLESLMQQDKRYLDSDLSLSSLAKALRTNSQKVSLVINSKLGYNFNEYVNRYRINHAVELLKNPQTKDLTIASLAADCGFNSLSTFNTAFKKITGTTPSALRNTIS